MRVLAVDPPSPRDLSGIIDCTAHSWTRLTLQRGKRGSRPVSVDSSAEHHLPGIIDCVAGRNAEIDELGPRGRRQDPQSRIRRYGERFHIS
jgi:hypothetical protein